MKKILIVMLMILSSVHLFDVQANTTVLSQLPEAIQQRLHERLNNQEDDAITQTKLTASDGASDDYFGQSVAIDGTTLVVSARFDDENGTDSGSVYVYDLTKTSADTGFERKITASDGTSGDKFGRSIAIDGTTLVVGVHFDDDNGSQSGSVYVYDLTKNSGDVGFERKIIASDGASADYFGHQIALDESTLVVSSHHNDDNGTNSGSVYVYDLSLDGNAETTGNPATSYADGFERKITASDGAANDNFGHTVAIEETTLVVGAPVDDDNGENSGSVYVYDLTKNSLDAGFERKITASDGAVDDRFGRIVAIDGTTLVVGANLGDDNGANSGSVYVYDLTLDGNAETTGNPATPYVDGFETKITASDGAAGDEFGYSVAIDGTTLVVGAHLDDDKVANLGSVYVYDLTKTSGDDGFETKITASDGASDDRFGSSVAIDGSTLVVGAYGDDENGLNSGSIYIYNGTFGSGNSDTEDPIRETKLTAFDGAENDYFGYSVALNGTTLVIGASREGSNGAVYVYDLTKDSNEVGFERKIRASDGASDDIFGKSVAIDGTTLVVGSDSDDVNALNSGSVYVYDLTKTSADTGFETKITASDGKKYDYFGFTVSIQNTTVVVGTYNANTVYVYDLNKSSGDDGFETKITASDGAASDHFGSSVAIDGNKLVVGAYFNDYDNLTNPGSVYVYDLTKNSGDEGFERKITASDGETDDFFAQSVAIDGNTLVVGAWSDDANGINSGAVYVYDLTLDGNAETTGNPATPYVDGFETKITASDNSPSDQFGISVAIDGTILVVGSDSDDVNALNSGSVYVYDLTKTPEDDGFETKITASDGETYDYFGHLVMIDGTTLVVSTHFDDDNGTDSGSVYIYSGTFGSGTTKTDEEWASEITTMIDALSEPYVRADVEAARDAYDALTTEQQALVTNYQTLLDAEQALADQDAAAAVDALIDALTDPYDIDAIDAARDAYENLTETQKALVTGLTDLEEAEQTYADIDAASIVDGMIAALTEPYDAVAVYDARQAYDSLTETQKGYVTRLPELEVAEQALADINAAAAVDALIDALTSPYVRADVEAARAAYDALTETQQLLVTGLPVLEAAEAGLVDQALAQAVELLINTLTKPYDSDAVQTARDAYDALTETQQALVTNYQALLDAEQAVADIDAAAAVDALIDALSAPYDPESVQAAREAYENLTDEQQILVTGLLDLETAEDTLMNETEAAGVDALIQTLTEESTEEEVEAVREAYESLTEEQQALVTQLPTLVTYEQQFASPDSTGLVFFMIFFIGVISAVIYFGFYKRDREEKKTVEPAPVVAPSKVEKEDTVSKAFMKKKLRELRETLIKKYDYAEFFIYTDEQLDLLIEHQPKTKAEFIKVKGFGEKKYTNFGKEVIRLFKTYKLK